MLELKYKKLKNNIKTLKKVAVAFSGGVDSAFLLKAAIEAIGNDSVFAITVKSQVFTEGEINESIAMAEELCVKHKVLDMDILSLLGFKTNSPERCYFCKNFIFENIIKLAREEGFDTILDGTNADDEGDFRPGIKALDELGVISPLRDDGFTKNDIRLLSKKLGLKTHDKPSLACIASRIPYGESITEEKLERIKKSEQYIRELGFKQLRVRHHNYIARIELLPEDFHKVFTKDLNKQIDKKLKSFGFKYVSIDLAGYRSGSLNEEVDK